MTRRFDVVTEGPLAPFASGYWEALRRLGYKDDQASKHMLVFGHLNAWMAERGMSPGELSAGVVEGFFAARRRAGHEWLITGLAAKPLLGFLHETGAVYVAV